MGKSTFEQVLKGLAGLLIVCLSLVIADVFHERIVNAGDKAPSFSITADNGRTFTPADFGGKVLVLHFWATWCPPCIEELPQLNQFARDTAGMGVVVLGVSVDKNQRIYREFLKRAGVAFPTALDPDANISSDYGTFKFPETYIVDSHGKVIEKFPGPVNWNDPNIMATIKTQL